MQAKSSAVSTPRRRVTLAVPGRPAELALPVGAATDFNGHPIDCEWIEDYRTEGDGMGGTREDSGLQSINAKI